MKPPSEVIPQETPALIIIATVIALVSLVGAGALLGILLGLVGRLLWTF